MKNAYLLFHLNLAFSSIEKESYSDVIKKCYWPLLRMASLENYKLNIELTGWTLEQINSIDRSWVIEFKNLLTIGKAELIGSGYSQIIGPINHFALNEKNQQIGLETYNEILGITPKIALVNEMALSASMADLYKQFGYSALVMDGPNLERSSNFNREKLNWLKGIKQNIPIIDSDFILFQKMQHFSHGDISLRNWKNFIKTHSKNLPYISIYSNDAETFDFRPGRFVAERSFNKVGEWARMEKGIDSLVSDGQYTLCSLTELLVLEKRKLKKSVAIINSIKHPNPVKKQNKYNLSRWSVSGRDDININALSHSFTEHFLASSINNSYEWKKILTLSASDFRTHITTKRWALLQRKITSMQKTYKLKSSLKSLIPEMNAFKDAICTYRDDDGLKLVLENKFFKLVLSNQRGLSIHQLTYAKHNWMPSIQTIEHGSLNEIEHSVDYYSNHTIIEIPSSKIKITDLVPVKPRVTRSKDGSVSISMKIETPFGFLQKKLKVFVKGEILCTYLIPPNLPPASLVRVGNFTVGREFHKNLKYLESHNGGSQEERFKLDDNCDHGASVNSFVSCGTGIGATGGVLTLSSPKHRIRFQWDRSQFAPLVLVTNNKHFLRSSFSMSEIDETSKGPLSYPEANILISADN
jgi:hypothetical protein